MLYLNLLLKLLNLIFNSHLANLQLPSPFPSFNNGVEEGKGFIQPYLLPQCAEPFPVDEAALFSLQTSQLMIRCKMKLGGVWCTRYLCRDTLWSRQWYALKTDPNSSEVNKWKSDLMIYSWPAVSLYLGDIFRSISHVNEEEKWNWGRKKCT